MRNGHEMTELDKIFARNLKMTMEIVGINGLDLSKKTNLVHSTVYDVLNKKRKNVSINIANKLAEGLGVSVGVLLMEREFTEYDKSVIKAMIEKGNQC